MKFRNPLPHLSCRYIPMAHRRWPRGFEHLQYEHPKHPPNKKQRNDGPRDVNYPVASCFRFPKIKHGAMVAGSARVALCHDAHRPATPPPADACVVVQKRLWEVPTNASNYSQCRKYGDRMNSNSLRFSRGVIAADSV